MGQTKPHGQQRGTQHGNRPGQTPLHQERDRGRREIDTHEPGGDGQAKPGSRRTRKAAGAPTPTRKRAGRVW